MATRIDNYLGYLFEAEDIGTAKTIIQRQQALGASTNPLSPGTNDQRGMFEYGRRYKQQAWAFKTLAADIRNSLGVPFDPNMKTTIGSKSKYNLSEMAAAFTQNVKSLLDMEDLEIAEDLDKLTGLLQGFAELFEELAGFFTFKGRKAYLEGNPERILLSKTYHNIATQMRNLYFMFTGTTMNTLSSKVGNIKSALKSADAILQNLGPELVIGSPTDIPNPE